MTQKFNIGSAALIASPITCKEFDEISGYEKNEVNSVEEGGNEVPTAMERKLKARQLTMMCIGGTIGTGLFLGMGSSLNDGGPMGILLGYIIMSVNKQVFVFNSSLYV